MPRPRSSRAQPRFNRRPGFAAFRVQTWTESGGGFGRATPPDEWPNEEAARDNAKRRRGLVRVVNHYGVEIGRWRNGRPLDGARKPIDIETSEAKP